MNCKYTYLDGKVIIEDENGKKKVIEYITPRLQEDPDIKALLEE